MSRASRGEAQRLRRARRQGQRELRKAQRAAGIQRQGHTTRPNRKSILQCREEEQQARSEAVLTHARLIRQQLPILQEEFSRIPDPRNPQLIQHTLNTLMVYGMLMFALQTGSRRRSNETLSAPAMRVSLQTLFPDLQSLPHQETLHRLLRRLDPLRLEAAHLALMRSLLKDKKFADHRVEGCYLIGIDGTQKLVRDQLPAEQWLQREVGAEGKKKTQYYVYVLEAKLVLSNGVSLPLMSEFLDYGKGDCEREKQDCELRAFMRLTTRLRDAFPHLAILLLLDGLYACGPVFDRCRDYGWHYMAVLQDASLPQVWQEVKGLGKLLGPEDRLEQNWAGRKQSFQMVNQIAYHWEANGRKHVTLNVVTCRETWEEIDENNQKVQRISNWAWVSDLPFSRATVHALCNLAGRNRWSVEEAILTEKKGGYGYEHCYAYNWNAMRGYHYLMHLGHLLNLLASFLGPLVGVVKERGTRGFLLWIRETLSGLWLCLEQLKERLDEPFQLRLLFPLPEFPTSTG